MRMVHQIVAMTPQRQTLTATPVALRSQSGGWYFGRKVGVACYIHRHAIPSAWMQAEVKRHEIQGREVKRHAWMFM